MMNSSGVDSYGRGALAAMGGSTADNFGTHRWTVYEGSVPKANIEGGSCLSPSTGSTSSCTVSVAVTGGATANNNEGSFGHLHPHPHGGGSPIKSANGIQQNKIPRAPHHLNSVTKSSPSARGRRAAKTTVNLSPRGANRYIPYEEEGRVVGGGGGGLRGVTVSPMSSGRLIGGVAYDTRKTNFKIPPATIATQAGTKPLSEGQQHASARQKGASSSPRGRGLSEEEKSPLLFPQSLGSSTCKGSGHEATYVKSGTPRKTPNVRTLSPSTSREKGRGGGGVREDHEARPYGSSSARQQIRNTSTYDTNGEKASPPFSSSSFLSHLLEGNGAGLGESYQTELRTPLQKNVRAKIFGASRRHRDVLPDGASSASHYVQLRALAVELERQRKRTVSASQQRGASSVTVTFSPPTSPNKVLPASPSSPVPTRPTTSKITTIEDSVVSSMLFPTDDSGRRTVIGNDNATATVNENERQREFNFYYVVDRPEHQAPPPRQGTESVAGIRNSPSDMQTVISDGEGRSSRTEHPSIYSHVKKTNAAGEAAQQQQRTTAGASTIATVVPLGTPSLVALNATLRESYNKLCVAEAQERATATEAFVKELRLLEDHKAAIAYLDDRNELLAGTESRRREAKFRSELEAVSGEREESERISIIIREERVRGTLLRLFRQGHAAALLKEKVKELTALEDARRFKFTELEAKNRRIILKQVAEEVLYVRSVNPFGGHCPFFRGDDCPFSGDKGAHGQAVSREHFRQLPQELERRMRGIVDSPEGVRARANDTARISRASQFGEFLESRERRSAQHERELQQHVEKKRRNTQHLQGLHAAMENEISSILRAPAGEGGKAFEGQCSSVATDFKDEGTLAYEAEKERNDSSVPIFVREVKHFNLLMKSLDADVQASHNLDSRDSLRRLLSKPA